MKELCCNVHISEMQDILEYAKKALTEGIVKDDAILYAICDMEQEIGEWMQEPHYSYNVRLTSSYR